MGTAVAGAVPRRGMAALGAGVAILAAMGSVARAAFVDVSPTIPAASGAAWNDFDGDGDPDAAVSVLAGSPAGCRIFRNDRGAFADVTVDAFPGAAFPAGIGLSWADIDGDGDLDLCVGGQGTGGALYRNDGGVFTQRPGGDLDVAISSGRGVLWVDVDLDGDLDLYRTCAGTSRLYRNDGLFVFRDVTPGPLALTGLQTGAWADYDGDGDPDLYGPAQSAVASLMRNDGNFSFVNVAAAAGVNSNVNALGTDWGDFDGDGNLDLWVGNLSGTDRLFRNLGSGVFTDVTPAIAESTGTVSNFVDYDNDGDLDLFQGSYSGTGTNSSILLRNDGASWSRVATAFPTAILAIGSSFADMDADGDVDLLLAVENGASRIYRNDLPGGAHWVHLVLEGTVSNRAGIGARVTLTAGGRTQTREVSGGAHWLSQNSVPVEFGLGAATSVTSLTVRWPSGIVQAVPPPGVDRVTRVVEPGFTPKGALAGGYTPGAAIDLQLERRGVPVTNAAVFFRAAGSGGSFSAATMTIDDVADHLAAAIPSGTATENGVEYYVLYAMRGGTPRAFPFAGPAEPAFLPANLGTRVRPGGAGASEYELVSVPFAAQPASLAGVLEDDLGGYDPKKWRFGRFAPAAGAYLEGANAGALAPGRGFWLVQRSPVAIDATGVSTSTVGGITIPVDPGWNQIGNPYLFPISTAAIDRSNAPDVGTRVVGRSGGSYADVTSLAAWQGYWVFNGGSGTQTIVIPGLIGAPSPPPPAPGAEAWRWRIAVSARGETSADLDNIAGAADAPEQFDAPEPPGLPGTVRAYFAATEGPVREWTRLARADGANGASFPLVVEAADGDARLAFDGLASLPAGWSALLVADETLTALDVTDDTAITLPAGSVTRFRLVVGDRDAIAAARDGRDLAIEGVRLAEPRPNPSASDTELAFALPAASRVDLAVYDIAGRLVRSVLRGPAAAGVHRVTWDGRNDRGTGVTAGVYFAKLRVDGVERTVKIVRVG